MDGWKPSTGLGALALGLFVTAVVALSAPPMEMRSYGYLFGMVACGTLALIHLGAASLRGGLGVWERVLQLAEMHQKLQPAPEPVGAEPVADEADEPDTAPNYGPAWRAACHRFVTAGNLYGFGVRALAAGEHQVIGWDDWGALRDYLIEAGVLTDRGGTRWAAGWNWQEWQARYAALPLPPVSKAPPEVLLTVNRQRQQPQQQPQRASDAVIDGEKG
jgi:hypothetical protein